MEWSTIIETKANDFVTERLSVIRDMNMNKSINQCTSIAEITKKAKLTCFE